MGEGSNGDRAAECTRAVDVGNSVCMKFSSHHGSGEPTMCLARTIPGAARRLSCGDVRPMRVANEHVRFSCTPIATAEKLGEGPVGSASCTGVLRKCTRAARLPARGDQDEPATLVHEETHASRRGHGCVAVTAIGRTASSV